MFIECINNNGMLLLCACIICFFYFRTMPGANDQKHRYQTTGAIAQRGYAGTFVTAASMAFSHNKLYYYTIIYLYLAN